MKRIKLFRMLAIGIILSLLVVVIPVSPALAAREIDLEEDECKIGENIDITGEDWPTPDPGGIPPYDPYVEIYFAFSDEEITRGQDLDDDVTTYEFVKDVDIDNDGEFDTYFEVPSRLTDGDDDEDVRGGTYYVCVTLDGGVDIKAVAEFTITAGEITEFAPDSGPVGTEVDISGEDFGEDEELTIEYDGDEIDIDGDVDTDGNGDFDCTVLIPLSAAGDHTVTIKDESLTEVEETFTVEPAMSFSPTQAPPGDTVEVSGTGYGDRMDVDIFLGTGTASVATKETDRDGNFTVSFIVPELDEGTYALVAEDEDGNDDEGSFIVEIGIETTISPVTSSASPGHVGQSVTVSGIGFLANSTVTITYATTPTTVATTTSDAEGAFTATFDIPASEPGAHTITASDGTNSLNVPFYMEAQAPEIPQPLLPQDGAKTESMTLFDWEAVTDDSGVAYDLQIATDEEFTASAMVLEKTGLTESEYTLTKEEALESRSAEEPYYWRMRAVDGVGNASQWTGLGEFSVGFTWPDWIIHLWWGLGVLGAIFFGYYMGKRRAYYY